MRKRRKVAKRETSRKGIAKVGKHQVYPELISVDAHQRSIRS